MLLKQIVDVDKTGVLRSAVNFGMMTDPDTNLDLCKGFIFNYNPKTPLTSTVGILDRLRHSFKSRNDANIHLMIQQYGKGKSHFAVAIANFFGKPCDSPEVQGVLQQVEKAVGAKSKGLVENLRIFKRDRRFLVLCLSGDQSGNLKKQFLKVVLQALEAEGLGESAIAHNICKEPLEYLEGLSPGDRGAANAYLEEQDLNQDVNSLIKLLREHNTRAIRTVKQIAKHLTNIWASFEEEIDIEAILNDLVTNLCTGPDAPFKGILILFDELNYYLKEWATDEVGAGGTAIQNITNSCETHRSKIALLSFTQIDPNRAVGISAAARESYLKVSTRLAPNDATYNPASSLELVLDSLVIQKEAEPAWQSFRERWNTTLLEESRAAHETYIPTYRERGWMLQEFHDRLTMGCFPLHPITSYLLANLSFTQDRTAIQFLRGDVANFIEQEAIEVNGRLNYIYPTALIDAFRESFSDSQDFKSFQDACDAVASSDNPDELLVLKAIFLHHASGSRLTKRDTQRHEELLEKLTGLTQSKLKVALHTLVQVRQVINDQSATHTYRFFRGMNPSALEDDINDQTRNEIATVESVVQYSQGKVSRFLNSPTLQALEFIQQKQQVADDWQFEHKFYTIDHLKRDLSGHQMLRKTRDRGILAYVLASTPEELEAFRCTVDQDLTLSPNKHGIAIAIPKEGIGELDRILLKLKRLESPELSNQRRLFGDAYSQLRDRWETELNTTLKRILKPQSCTFHSIVQDKIPTQKRTTPSHVISALLLEQYSFVPPIASVDKLRSGHTTGSKITSFIAKRLFEGSFSVSSLPSERSYQTTLDEVLCRVWGLFKKTSSEYKLQIPTQENIRAAWDLISQKTALDGQPQSITNLKDLWDVLSQAPYGYNEYTFTVLLAGWLAYHRREVVLRGATVAKLKRGQSAKIDERSLKAWVMTDDPNESSILEKPKDFVREWIAKGNSSKLIRQERLEIPECPPSPMPFDTAEDYLAAATQFLESTEAEDVERTKVQQSLQLVETEAAKVRDWFQPVEQAEQLSESTPLSDLLSIYDALFQKTPSIQLRSDVISVRASQTQRDRQQAAQAALRDRLEQHITTLQQNAETLSDRDACTRYSNELKDTIAQLERSPNCPPHFIETLTTVQKAAELTRRKLEESNRIKDRFKEIRELSQQLGNYYTQSDYAEKFTQIEQLNTGIPENTDEGREARQIITDLAKDYQALVDKIEAWEEREENAVSSAAVLSLLEEIHKQSQRFTNDDDRRRVEVLGQKLKEKVSVVQAQDNAEKLLKQELSNTTTIAQQKLQRIRDLPFTKIADIFQVYQELIATKFSETAAPSPALQTAQEQLSKFQEKGRSLLNDKFREICDRKITNLKDAQNIDLLLQRSYELVDGQEEFADIAADLATARQQLATRKQDIEQQAQRKKAEAEDSKIIQQIRQYRSDRMNTLALCEEGLQVIQRQQSALHFPELHQAEIDKLKAGLTQRIQSFCDRLASVRDRLTSLTTVPELDQVQSDYNRLELAFQHSSDEEGYRAIAPKIQELRADLQHIYDAEQRYRNCNAIAACQELRDQLGDIQVTLHDLDRFRVVFTQLDGKIQAKIKAFLQGLDKIESQLGDAETVSQVEDIRLQLLKQATCFTHSDAESCYYQLLDEAKAVSEFLQMLGDLNSDSYESCTASVEKLTAWKAGLSNCSKQLSDRVQQALSDLERQRTVLQEKHTAAAENWLKQLGQDAGEAGRTADNHQRLERYAAIGDRIQKEQSKYVQYLTSEKKNTITYIQHQCQVEQRKNQANQVIVSFRQLPIDQRRQVYEQLAQYLHDSNS
jgi:hypothetical protein